MNIVEFVSMAEYDWQDIYIYSDTSEFWGSVKEFLTSLEDSEELEKFKNRKVKTYYTSPGVFGLLCIIIENP